MTIEFENPFIPTEGILGLISRHRPGHALERQFYMDPEIFELDMERLLRRHWHCLAHESIIPNNGDFELFDLGGEQIILTRDGNGDVHGLLNMCRHRGAQVCTKKKGTARAFVCPYHAWTYGNDGTLKAARLMPKDFDRSAYGLKKVHVRVAEGLVFISFAETPLEFDHVEQALRVSAGRYGWAKAKVAHRETYTIDGNWKLAIENYVECYHCGPAHPEYAQTHALQQPAETLDEMNAAVEKRLDNLGIEVGISDQWQNSINGKEAVDVFRYPLYDGVCSGTEDGAPVAPLMGDFTNYDGAVLAFHIGGTSFFISYPDYGMIYRFIPVGPDRCDMEQIWLVRGDAEEGKDYNLEQLCWLWNVTTQEDKSIIEHTARGVRSRYFEPGPLAPMEHRELRFVSWYLEELARP